MDSQTNGVGSEPGSPRLEDLPKIPESLAAEVHSPTHQLKHVEITEKFILPTPEDVTQEKQEQLLEDVVEAIESFDKAELNPTQTQVYDDLPSKEDLELAKDLAAVEERHEQVVQKIEEFDLGELVKTETQVKHSLPSPQDIALERHQEAHVSLNEQIESGKIELKPAETVEKILLPSKEEVAAEKVRSLAAAFNQNDLKHVIPIVRHGLPSKEEYSRDKVKSLAAKFDHGKLNKVETKESHQIRVMSNGD